MLTCQTCVGIPRDHPESYHSFMWNNFFKHIDIRAENTHILDGNAADLEAECHAFEDKIKAAGGIELFVGGQMSIAIAVHNYHKYNRRKQLFYFLIIITFFFSSSS